MHSHATVKTTQKVAMIMQEVDVLSEDLFVKFILQCSIIVSDGITKILLDGPIADKYQFGLVWDTLSDEEASDIINARGDYEGLSHLLISHGHQDHIDYDRACAFTGKTGGKVIAASEIFTRIPDLFGASDERIDPEKAVILEGEEGMVKAGSFDVYYYKTEHLPGIKLVMDEHYAFVLVSEKGKIFFSGDMCMDDVTTEKILKHGEVDYAIVNPAIIMNKQWTANLMKIPAKKTYVCHLPSEDNDALCFRQYAMHARKRPKFDYELLLEPKSVL